MQRIETFSDGDTFEHDGLTFRVTFPYDDDASTPWEREDGHGPVSEWRSAGYTGRAAKSPGERVLCTDRGSARFYDFAEAIKIAKRDGWGLCASDLDALRVKLRREPTPGDIVARAVEQDFDRLRRWCSDQWCYVGVVVTLLDVEGDETDERDSLWGIESDSPEYLAEVARDLAAEIAARVGDRVEVPARPAAYVVRNVGTEART